VLQKRNVVVKASGEPLLCDFGLSRIRHEITRSCTTIRQGGRLRFVAPEIYFGEENARINESSDIYSLAMTIYALGSGKLPFGELTHELGACRAARKGQRPSKPESIGGLTVGDTKLLWSITTKMWDHEPLRRLTASVARDEVLRSGLIPPASTALSPPSFTKYALP
jgi:serine/threonine protein kinase